MILILNATLNPISLSPVNMSNSYIQAVSLHHSLTHSLSGFQVKALPGLGTTIDVILVDGKINEGASVVLAGTDGPIVTQIRGLLMPQPMKELRVKVRQFDIRKEVLAVWGWLGSQVV